MSLLKCEKCGWIGDDSIMVIPEECPQCEVLKTPDEWAEQQRVIILDPDGWRFAHGGLMPKDYSEKISESEFNIRKMWSTIQPLADKG